MNIDETLISRLENLAKLSLSSEERELFKQDLEKMIDMINNLKKIDTRDVKPLIQMTDEINVLREDKAGQMLNQEQALLNSSKHDDAFFQVPNLFKKSDKKE